MASSIDVTLTPDADESLRRFVHSLPETFEQGGRVIYRQRNEIRVFDLPDGRQINVKRYRVPPLPLRFVYTLFRAPKARRAYDYALRLRQAGIETPTPLACLIERQGGLLRRSYFVSEQVPHDRNFYEFGRGGIDGREDILRAFARFTARVHEAGFLHADYSPGNILFRKGAQGIDFCLVDINRMHFGPVSVRSGCENFARLWGGDGMFFLLAKVYAEARGADEVQCTAWMLSARRAFWRRFARKRPLPIALDDVAAEGHRKKLSVILSTYNQPEWLEKVLWGYEAQTDRRFEVVIADDGSDDRTRSLIERMQGEVTFPIRHVWHPDNGFRKCEILNRAIAEATTGYLLFSDGDCIPRCDFVAVHLARRAPGRFLSGGYHKLPMVTSKAITRDDILSGRCFRSPWLKSHGMPRSFKNNKLTAFGLKERLLNTFTPTRPTWNGHNASGWLLDILAANGFDERMAYGGEDRELGERLENAGIRGRQIRYSAICLHLDHSRGYVTPDALRFNRALRRETRTRRLTRTPFGIVKEEQPKQQPEV